MIAPALLEQSEATNVGGGSALQLLTKLPKLAMPVSFAGGGDGLGNILAKAFKGVSVF